jgi:hypothetical protein
VRVPNPDVPKAGVPEGLHEKVMQELREMRAAADAPGRGRFTTQELSDPQNLSMERAVPLHRGKWRIMPPGVEADTD